MMDGQTVWACDEIARLRSEAVGYQIELRQRDAEVQRLQELLREVANSGVSLDDERLGTVEVQIERDTWEGPLAALREEG